MSTDNYKPDLSSQGSAQSSEPVAAQKDSNQELIRSTSILSAGTLTSRILGFFRDIVLARFLGTGLGADAFFVSFRIPNLFRSLVGEGATNSALVPVFSEYTEKQEKERLWEFISVIFTLGLMILSAITVLGIVFAPVIVRCIAPGFIIYPEKLLLTIKLTRIMFPYLILIGLTAYCMGILYTLRVFSVSAFSPSLLNISIIISALFSSKFLSEPIFGLAIGILVGGALQFGVQFFAVLKKGIRFRIPRTLKHEGARKVGRLLLPRVFGASIYQFSVFIDTFCASLSLIVGAGGIAAISYSSRVIQLPLGLFGVALASAILPKLSTLNARQDQEGFRRTLVFALENIFFIMLPISFAVMVLSVPIVRILFQRGAFGVYSTQITSSALFFYAIGLLGFGAMKIMVAGFHARQDTKTPVKIAGLCLFINLILNLILMFPLKIGGIALASSVAVTTNFILLVRFMDRKFESFGLNLLFYLVRVFLASLVMALVMFLLWTSFGAIAEMIKLILVALAGCVIYFLTCYFLKIEQAVHIGTLLQKTNPHP